MKLLTLITVLGFSLSGFTQILNNTFSDGDNIIIAQKSKQGVNFNFSRGNTMIPYCFIPFNYKKGIINLPQDKNGNEIGAVCKYISETEKKMTLDLEKHYETKKYDGVFFFSEKQSQSFFTCFKSKAELGRISETRCNDCQDLSHIRNQCIGNLSKVHTVALRKKKKLNKSTEEMFIDHINNSDRSNVEEGGDSSVSGYSNSSSNEVTAE